MSVCRRGGIKLLQCVYECVQEGWDQAPVTQLDIYLNLELVTDACQNGEYPTSNSNARCIRIPYLQHHRQLVPRQLTAQSP
jgi:hypothetical protein